MNDFFSDLFEEASRPSTSKLSEYDEEDLQNFFESAVPNARAQLLQAATAILGQLDDANIAQTQARAIGLSAKHVDSLAAFVKVNGSELKALARRLALAADDRLGAFEWSLRSVFFSKREEFKAQKKYAVLDFEVESTEKCEKVRLNCSKENVLAIRDKLGKLDEAIRQMFEENQSA